MTENDARYAILFGADMEPERIRHHPDTAGGRFVGIGAVSATDIGALELPLPDVSEVWGVVIRLAPGKTLDGPAVPVAMRTGEHLEATVLTRAADFDDLEAVLAEAHYWELPVPYRNALASRASLQSTKGATS